MEKPKASEAEADVSTLPDGRLFWMPEDKSGEGWDVVRVYDPSSKSWVKPEGSLTRFEIMSSRPVTEEKIAFLVERGILAK